MRQSQQKSKISAKQSKAKIITKENKENNIDVYKLKEYIKSQEEVEAKLAVECARTEAIFRMLGVLKSGSGKMQLNFMMKVLRHDEI